jgi:hypothetical protein
LSNDSEFQISFDNRYKNDRGLVCLITVDGTDFKIQEPTPFWKGWWSHKFNGPGLRYELGISIQSGDIVWAYGPFPCGKWPDITIFRHALKHQLDPGEMVEADNGYQGEPRKIRTKKDYLTKEDKQMKSVARARHETANKRIKQFGVMKQVFRHDINKHHYFLDATVVLTQLSIESGETLFKVEYNAN